MGQFTTPCPSLTVPMRVTVTSFAAADFSFPRRIGGEGDLVIVAGNGGAQNGFDTVTP